MGRHFTFTVDATIEGDYGICHIEPVEVEIYSWVYSYDGYAIAIGESAIPVELLLEKSFIPIKVHAYGVKGAFTNNELKLKRVYGEYDPKGYNCQISREELVDLIKEYVAETGSDRILDKIKEIL